MKRSTLKFISTAGLIAFPLSAHAISIQGDELNSTSNLGDFTGTFDYLASNSSSATITISLTNTSPGTSGYLTAFVFNNPGDMITSVTSFNSTDPDFSLLGAITFNDNVNGAPFGQFDLGASTGNGFEGGGNPSAGLAVGASATFTLVVAGRGLDTITAQTFFQTLSEGTGAGEGYEPFVARFRGFANDGSDKVPGDPGIPDHPVPEPATAALVLGSASAFFARRKRR